MTDNPANFMDVVLVILAAIGLHFALKPFFPAANRLFERIMFRPEHRSKR